MLLLELAVILGLVGLNGLLAGAEIAIVGMNQARLRQLAEARGRSARSLIALRADPERFFATVQIGITVVGAAAGAFGGATFARDLQEWLERVPWMAAYAEEASLAAVVALVSGLTLVLGELVPKSLGLRHAESYSLLTAPLLLWVSSMARPAVWLLTRSSNLVLSLFGDRRTTFAETRLSMAELSDLVDRAAQTGSVHPAAGEIAVRALEFSGLTAAQVMVPRTRMVGLEISSTPEEAKRTTLEYGYSRYPVYRGHLDEVVGYVMVKDMLALAWEGKLIALSDLVRPPHFVSEPTSAASLLQHMRENRIQMAIVVDEHGGTSGMVTVEDLVEEFVGEIFSEVRRIELEPWQRMPDGSVIAPGDLALRDLNRELNTELATGSRWSTLGGLCAALAARVPRQGETFTAPDGTRLLIESASERRVERVRIWPPEKPAAEQEDHELDRDPSSGQGPGEE
jgi:putative hemolysin